MSNTTKEQREAELAARDALYAKAKTQTIDTLPAFMAELAGVEQDYSTIIYAVSASALAAAYAMDRSPRGGITGFQASIVMWEFVRTWMHIRSSVALIQYDDLLFPQYAHKFTTISSDIWKDVQRKAAEHLEKKHEEAHPSVVAHWRSIVEGKVPFGLSVEGSAPAGGDV